jgi:hypothetical protein
LKEGKVDSTESIYNRQFKKVLTQNDLGLEGICVQLIICFRMVSIEKGATLLLMNTEEINPKAIVWQSRQLKRSSPTDSEKNIERKFLQRIILKV